MGTKIKSPVGKYFRTDRGAEHIYCYGEDEIFRAMFACIEVSDNGIKKKSWGSMSMLKKSTRKAFLKAYAKTIEHIDEIVEGGK